MKVMVIGASGMLGHMVYEYLKSVGIEVYGAGRRASSSINLSFDLQYITTYDEVAAVTLSLIERFNVDAIVNCAGIIKQRSDGVSYYTMIQVNSIAPLILAEFCEKKKIKFIQISTDCVFSGRRGMYIETDQPDPVDEYGKTKYFGEAPAPHLTIRTSIIGPEIHDQKVGLFEWFLCQDRTVDGYVNAIWSGVTTLQLSKVIHSVLIADSWLSGIVHIVTDPISKFDLLKQIGIVFEKNIKIRPFELVVPVNRSLMSTRSDFKIPPIADQLMELKRWEELKKKCGSNSATDSD